MNREGHTDIHRPGDWLDAFLENVPEEHRESLGQMQALREYGDHIATLPKRQQEDLWKKFNGALDERFPSRTLPIRDLPETSPSAPRPADDQEILERVLPVFQAPGDQSPQFHEMLFRRAMGQVEQELDESGMVSKWLRRKRLSFRIRKWMRDNLK